MIGSKCSVHGKAVDLSIESYNHSTPKERHAKNTIHFIINPLCSIESFICSKKNRERISNPTRRSKFRKWIGCLASEHSLRVLNIVPLTIMRRP